MVCTVNILINVQYLVKYLSVAITTMSQHNIGQNWVKKVYAEVNVWLPDHVLREGFNTRTLIEMKFPIDILTPPPPPHLV